MKSYYCILYIISLILTTVSCKENAKEYEILNDFIQYNKIDLGQIQENVYCFKDLHLSTEEEKVLGISLKNDNHCGTKIEKDRLAHMNHKNEMMSQMSFPLQSTDGSVFIIVSFYDVNSNNFHRLTTLYKLRRTNEHWKIIGSYEIITES